MTALPVPTVLATPVAASRVTTPSLPVLQWPGCSTRSVWVSEERERERETLDQISDICTCNVAIYYMYMYVHDQHLTLGEVSGEAYLRPQVDGGQWWYDGVAHPHSDIVLYVRQVWYPYLGNTRIMVHIHVASVILCLILCTITKPGIYTCCIYSTCMYMHDVHYITYIIG